MNEEQKYILILAGPPGTGKTYLANQIMKADAHWHILSYDDIKERYFDKYGFNNLSEKGALGDKAWKTFYLQLDELFQQSKKIIIDYPFSYKQEDTLTRMINQYQYKPNTLILYGEMHELYKRQKERDLEDARHIGHIVTRYKDGDFPNTPDDLDDFEQFKSRCDDRQYVHFHIGNYKRINVTHFEDVNLNEILLWINNQFKH
ncbi:AAA family ATPase [Mammaliicoccus sciuri]|uniref:AAA family ATPase n=1 Tax=Mammaliicoccus sciuri TaxID=1296 RepID=UPI002DBA30EB|nr:AAA family ATPase [Mammaliicoccus sciuri]MEB5759780.1 ATP-binding protein [Mammaliicoccus sciuri]